MMEETEQGHQHYLKSKPVTSTVVTFKRNKSAKTKVGHPRREGVNCPLCSRWFPCRNSLRGHVPAHTKEKPFKCLYCDFITSYSRVLKRHQKRMHERFSGISQSEDDKVKAESTKMYLCEICGFTATWEGHLLRHQVRHSKEKPFACSFQGCQRRYKLADHLKRHKIKHMVVTVKKRQGGTKNL